MAQRVVRRAYRASGYSSIVVDDGIPFTVHRASKKGAYEYTIALDAATGKTVSQNTPTTLYLEKHRLAAGKSEVEVIVDEEPDRAGINPRNLLIDRVPGDNARQVVAER
jgi:hypothetical protein